MGNMVHYTKDPARLTKALISWITASIIIAVATIYSNTTQIGQLAAAPADTPPVPSATGGLLELLDIIVGLTAGIIFLRWVYITTMNCRGFGARGMSYNPGQAVGTYFMPLYCLYKPYYSLKEIWQCSQNPLHWKGMKGSPAIISWWVLWNLSSYYTNIDQSSSNSHIDLNTILVSSMYTKSVHIIMCLLALYLVTSVYRMQEAWIHQKTEEPPQPDTLP